MKVWLLNIARDPLKAFGVCGASGAVLGAIEAFSDSGNVARLVGWQAFVLAALGGGMSCLGRWQNFVLTSERVEHQSPTNGRRVLGRPALIIALGLLCGAGFLLWQLVEAPRGYACGLPVAVTFIGAAFLIAAALGVICLDMLVRWMD